MSKGQVITVFGAKGGCGKTTFATNLAVALHARGRVCLVDLDLAFGDIACTLAMVPSHRMWGHAPVSTYRTGLDCVLAPDRPGDAERMPVTVVRDVLRSLPRAYAYVVIDTPARLSTHTLAALDLADHHVLLTSPERPSLTHLRSTLDMLDLLGRRPRSIVVNRADAGAGLTAADIDGVLRSPVAAYLPATRSLAASINRGVPLSESEPSHPFSTAVRRFADAHIRGEGVVRPTT